MESSETFQPQDLIRKLDEVAAGTSSDMSKAQTRALAGRAPSEVGVLRGFAQARR